MRPIHTVSDLVCAAGVGEILAELVNGGVRDGGRRLRRKEIERAGHTEERHFGVVRRIVEILHAEITPREIVGKGFDVGRA